MSGTASEGRPPRERRVVFHTSLLRGDNESVGGISTWTLRLANGLAQRGFEVHLAIRADEDSRSTPARARVRALISNRVRCHFLGDSRSLAALRLAWLLVRVNARTLVTAGHTFTERGLRIRRWLGARLHLVGTVRANCSLEMNALPDALKRARYRDRMLRYGDADAVVCVSDGVRQDLIDNFGLQPSKLMTIYNPIVSERLLLAAAQEPSIALPARFVLGVGRLVRQKDFPTLMRAFACLAAEFPELHLVILGEGEQRPPLDDLAIELGIADRFHLPGHLDNPAAVMARAQVLGSSSLWEGIANVIVEATGLGVPVVATDCPSGPAEVLQHGELGRLVPVGDAKAMAAALREVLLQPPDRERLRARGADFSDARSLDRYGQLFSGALD